MQTEPSEPGAEDEVVNYVFKLHPHNEGKAEMKLLKMYFIQDFMLSLTKKKTAPLNYLQINLIFSLMLNK